jgi:hypothetical protein
MPTLLLSEVYMSHEYQGTSNGRSERKLSKLGPGIVTAARLEELLGEHMPDPSTMSLLELADALVGMADAVLLVKHPDGTVSAQEWEGTK